MALAINLLLRASMLFFTLDSVFNGHDERYAGKDLGPRNIIIMVGFSLVIPAMYFIWHKWRSYPTGWDSLYLSIFWLDMFGNWANLYNVISFWDTFPHVHGPGALTLVFLGLGRKSVLEATGSTTMLHTGLEVWEYLGDVLFGSHNVQGVGDTEHDIACGLIGCWLYVGLWELYWRWRGRHGEEQDSDGRIVELHPKGQDERRSALASHR